MIPTALHRPASSVIVVAAAEQQQQPLLLLLLLLLLKLTLAIMLLLLLLLPPPHRPAASPHSAGRKLSGLNQRCSVAVDSHVAALSSHPTMVRVGVARV